MGVAVTLLFLFYHPPSFEMLHEHKSKRQQIKELDYPGIVLWTAGLVLFLMGISWVRLLECASQVGWLTVIRVEACSHGSLQL